MLMDETKNHRTGGRQSVLISVVLLAAIFVDGEASGETHPFSVHDMLAMDRVSDPQVSHDGERIVFVIRKTDLDANRGRTDLWLDPRARPGCCATHFSLLPEGSVAPGRALVRKDPRGAAHDPLVR